MSLSRSIARWKPAPAVQPALRVLHLVAGVLCLPAISLAAEPVLPFQFSVFMANGWGGPIEPFAEWHTGAYYLTPALQLSYSHRMHANWVIEASWLHLGAYRTEWTAPLTTHEGEIDKGYITEYINGVSVSPLFRMESGSRFAVRTGPSLSWLGTDLRSHWANDVSTRLAPGFNLCADSHLPNGAVIVWQYRYYHPERKSIHLFGVGLSATF